MAHPTLPSPGVVEVDPVAHCGNTTAGDYVNSFTFTELFSGWIDNRAVWNKGSHRIQEELKQLESTVPFTRTSFQGDNGSESPNSPLHESLTSDLRQRSLPTGDEEWTRGAVIR